MAKGLMASNISSFLFEEKTDQVRVSAEDYAQIIRVTYGSKGISESSLRAMTDMSMNPPKDVDDAHRRVRSVVSLLKYLLGPHTRATTVYDWALQQFRERHEELVFQSSRDQWFLTKFLYRLDVEFDTMSANLTKSWEAGHRRPDCLQGPAEIGEEVRRFLDGNEGL